MFRLEPLRVLKTGFYLNAIFTPLNMGLMAISCSRFKQSKNASLIICIYVMGSFVNFFGHFWVYLGLGLVSISKD